MNLRTLKKLSKRAAPILPLLGERREQFPAEHPNHGSNYVGIVVSARKHWQRAHVHPAYKPLDEREIVFTTRAGRRMAMRPPVSPRKGTVMVGGMSGYYEPEWDEESAWEALLTFVHVEFTDWNEEPPRALREFRRPADVLQAARELAAKWQAAGATGPLSPHGNSGRNTPSPNPQGGKA